MEWPTKTWSLTSKMIFIHNNGKATTLLLQWKNWIWLLGIMLAKVLVAADISRLPRWQRKDKEKVKKTMHLTLVQSWNRVILLTRLVANEKKMTSPGNPRSTI